MMNKSEELAKLLGIEPKKIIGSCKNGTNCRILGSACKGCIKRVECVEYPDFTKPENFVKLIETNVEKAISPKVLEFMAFCNKRKITLLFLVSFDTDREQFLENLIVYLNDNDIKDDGSITLLSHGDKTRQMVKEILQQTQWNY